MHSPGAATADERPAFGLGWRQLGWLLLVIVIGFSCVALLPNDEGSPPPGLNEGSE